MTDLGTMKFPFRLTNAFQRDRLADQIKQLEVSKEKPVFIKITDAKEKRSEAINRLAHMWYRQVSKQGQEYTPEQVKSIAKLRWGVPIMREHDYFNSRWMTLTAAFPSYEKQLEILEYLPVTSLMSNAEMSEYLTNFKQVMGDKYQLIEPQLEGIKL